MSLLTLTTDSDARKRIPLIGGLWGYFAAALVGVAQHSFKSNEKHNKGQPLHWSIDKSNDHAECCGRHMLDIQELLALFERGGYTPGEIATEEVITSILDEANAHAWRALALSQELHMRFREAPLPFNAKRSESESAPITATEIRAMQSGSVCYVPDDPNNVPDSTAAALVWRVRREGCEDMTCDASCEQHWRDA